MWTCLGLLNAFCVVVQILSHHYWWGAFGAVVTVLCFQKNEHPQ